MNEQNDWGIGILKRLRLVFGLLFLVVAAVHTSVRPASAELKSLVTPPYLVFDINDGAIYARHRTFDRWAPASLTKMMTAYTVFRALSLQHLAMNSPVRVSENALKEPPSKMGYPIGTVLTIETALKIIMVKSANDISVALAEATAGTEEAFIRLMNAHARRLGMTDSFFINPHGLHDPDQYTTAYDMGLLTRALTEEFPQYADFFDIPAIRVAGRRLRNHNALLRLFEGTTGMKTGYVCASGYNIAVRANRDGRDLAAIVLGGRSGLERNTRAALLLSNSFANSTPVNLAHIDDLERPQNANRIPYDITRLTCPRKYAARKVPDTRPADAPSAQDFDGIDTIVIEARLQREKDPFAKVPLPEKRPDYQKPQSPEPQTISAEAKAETSIGSNSEDEAVLVSGDVTPLTPKELAELYFKPRTDLRKDERLSLAGATGPNPFGVKHTNGGVYKAPIPVPEKRPALDLATTEE